MKLFVSVAFIICIIVIPAHADNTECSEYINAEEINSLNTISRHLYTMTGSGTMPATGSGTMAPCTGSGSISGSIYTQFNEPINTVHVDLQSSQENYPLLATTDINGEYAFNPIENDFNYLITPTKKGDDLNGISTLDVLLIANLVFGFGHDVSPYTLIAADVNQDQHVNIDDVVELLYLIIGRNEALGQSWVFVDASKPFFDEANPWPYIDDIFVNQLNGSSTENDFVGIKVGDLTGNANPWIKAEAESRTHPKVRMYTDDIFMDKDEIYTINFFSDELKDIKGMQIFLGYDGIEVMEIHSGILDADKAAFNQSDQTVFMSWYGVTETQSKILFSMTISVEENGFLSDRIQNFTQWLPTEAYIGEALDIKPVEISFSTINSVKDGLTLYQNSPNPFFTQTEISYTLAEDGIVLLDIFDSSGRLVSQKRQAALSGHNIFRVNREGIDKAGLYYYTLSFKGIVKTKSMLLID